MPFHIYRHLLPTVLYAACGPVRLLPRILPSDVALLPISPCYCHRLRFPSPMPLGDSQVYLPALLMPLISCYARLHPFILTISHFKRGFVPPRTALPAPPAPLRVLPRLLPRWFVLTRLPFTFLPGCRAAQYSWYIPNIDLLCLFFPDLSFPISCCSFFPVLFYHHYSFLVTGCHLHCPLVLGSSAVVSCTCLLATTQICCVFTTYPWHVIQHLMLPPGLLDCRIHFHYPRSTCWAFTHSLSIHYRDSGPSVILYTLHVSDYLQALLLLAFIVLYFLYVTAWLLLSLALPVLCSMTCMPFNLPQNTAYHAICLPSCY